MAATLALNGGPKAVTNDLIGWPQFSEDAIRAVESVLRSGDVNYWTGSKGMAFEKAFAEENGLFVIEDNAEAFGGEYKGRKTGTLGHMAACSFCQNKTFTTGGEGGMVTTDDEELAWKARSFRDHG